MAQTIKLRRSAVAGNVPTTSQLGLGELAINTADGKIYFEKNDGSATIQTIVTTNSQTTGSLEVTANISGSATSTGSFGRVEITSGKVLGDSTSAVSIPFSIVGGTSAAAGGLKFGAYDANYGGIWSAGVTPAAGNYAFLSKGSRTILNTTTDIGLYKDDATILLFANSTGVAIGGSDSPSYKLDVGGTGRFTGNLTLGGNLVGDNATDISAVNDITALGDISGSSTSTGSFGNVESTLNGRIIGNLTELIKVTVVSDGGNHYAFEGATAPSLQVSEGKIYRFDISDSTNGSHPFRLSQTLDGGHGGGSAYTTGVTVVGTQGQAGAYLELQVTKATANHLYYYCTAHPGMGNDGKIMKNDLTNLHMISGSSISSGSFGSLKIDGATVDFTGLPTSDPGVAGRLWNDSNTLKISAG